VARAVQAYLLTLCQIFVLKHVRLLIKEGYVSFQVGIHQSLTSSNIKKRVAEKYYKNK